MFTNLDTSGICNTLNNNLVMLQVAPDVPLPTSNQLLTGVPRERPVVTHYHQINLYIAILDQNEHTSNVPTYFSTKSQSFDRKKMKKKVKCYLVIRL